MKKKLTYLLLLCLIYVAQTLNSYAQTPATATWLLTKADQTTGSVTGEITAQEQSLTGMSVSSYLSLANGQRLSDNTNWPAESAAQAGRHADYVIAPKNSFEMLVKSITLDMAFNSSTACKVDIAWSANGIDFKELASGLEIASYASGSAVTYPFNDLALFVPAGKSFTLRVSPWVISAQANKYFVSRNVTINAVTGVVGTLPLDFVSFTAKINKTAGKGVDLSWTTVNEINTSKFEVERAGSSGNFTAIGELRSVNIAGTHRYVFIDKNPGSGTIYYRIKQTDLDGKHTYSDVKEVTTIPESSSKISVYPNPVSGNLTIDYPEATSASDIKIINIEGKRVGEIAVAKGSTSTSANMSFLTTGKYILIFSNAGRAKYTTFIKN